MYTQNQGRGTRPLLWGSPQPISTDKRPVVLLTGATSGIGLAMARLLWEQKEYRVVITTRQTSLRKISNEPFKNTDRFWIRQLDITSRENIYELVEEIETYWGGVDILINNAGVAYRSVVEDMTCMDEEIQIKTNYCGPFCLVRTVINSMRKKRSGRIINISSVGGIMAMPTMASYSASKFALEGATEALWYEMKPWNIKVSLIQPGFVNSESYKNVRYTGKFHYYNQDSSYLPYYEHMSRLISRLMRFSPSTPHHIAKLILKTMKAKNPRLRIPATLDAYVFSLLRKLLPARIYHQVFYYLLPDVKKWAKEPPGEKKTTQQLDPRVLKTVQQVE